MLALTIEERVKTFVKGKVLLSCPLGIEILFVEAPLLDKRCCFWYPVRVPAAGREQERLLCVVGLRRRGQAHFLFGGKHYGMGHARHAGIFEVVWATCMKYSEGFTKLSWSLLTFAGMAVSFFLLARATKTLPLGTAYAVWTGIGALGSVIVGIILFKEPVTAGRLIFAALLLIGIIGLKITSA